MVVVVAALALGGCLGWGTAPRNVNPTQADLHANVSCDANSSSNPCQAYFQYWPDGQPGQVKKAPQPPVVDTTAISNFDLTQTVTGLTPGTLYHYELCGQGDQNVTQPLCFGRPSGSVNPPGTLPTDLDSTQNFVTANPGGNPATNATIDQGRATSSGETNGIIYSRDVGESVQFSSNPPKSLWTFGDTGVEQNGNPVGFIPGSTAAIGTYTPGSPSVSLTEIPTNKACSHGTCQLLGNPPPLQNCPPDYHQIRYPSAMAKESGSSKVVIYYNDTCFPQSTCCVQNAGVTEYDPNTNTFTQPFTTLFHDANSNVPGTEIFGNVSTYNNDGYLYLFGSTPGFLFGSNVIVARVPFNATSFKNPAAYQWYGNGTWGSEANATPVSTGGSKLGTGIAFYPSKGVFAMLSVFSTSFDVYTSPAPWGPWTKTVSGILPDPCNAGTFGCYAISGHPELSTSTLLTYTWMSTDDGHIRIGTVPW